MRAGYLSFWWDEELYIRSELWQVYRVEWWLSDEEELRWVTDVRGSIYMHKLGLIVERDGIEITAKFNIWCKAFDYITAQSTIANNIGEMCSRERTFKLPQVPPYEAPRQRQNTPNSNSNPPSRIPLAASHTSLPKISQLPAAFFPKLRPRIQSSAKSLTSSSSSSISLWHIIHRLCTRRNSKKASEPSERESNRGRAYFIPIRREWRRRRGEPISRRRAEESRRGPGGLVSLSLSCSWSSRARKPESQLVKLITDDQSIRRHS